jgi:hypothetical protein
VAAQRAAANSHANAATAAAAAQHTRALAIHNPLPPLDLLLPPSPPASAAARRRLRKTCRRALENGTLCSARWSSPLRPIRSKRSLGELTPQDGSTHKRGASPAAKRRPAPIGLTQPMVGGLDRCAERPTHTRVRSIQPRAV